MAYTIVFKDKQMGIKCSKCNLTSFNPNDIKFRYCGKCNKFHYYEEKV